MRSLRVAASTLVLLLSLLGSLSAQEGGATELRGTTVSSETGEVVAGAWIALAGESWGTYSWNDGHFWLPEVPAGARAYEVHALGFADAQLTLDPSAAQVVIELTPDAEMQAGLADLMSQLQRRRNRGGDLRVFDREALAFNGYFELGDFLQQHGVRRVSKVCLDEQPGTVGLLQRESHQFYLAETFGSMLRLYTEDFIEQAARGRWQLQQEPRVCTGPVS